MPYPVKELEPKRIDLNLDTEFNFLAVALFGPRKNLEHTIKWFVEEFREDPSVGLVLKASFISGSKIDKFHTEKYL
ncbi:MAG TPA: hypothetical protein DCM40_07420, partial [Maribacter sp.]|nr:hypothetical protein [Maribacter sp.]